MRFFFLQLLSMIQVSKDHRFLAPGAKSFLFSYFFFFLAIFSSTSWIKLHVLLYSVFVVVVVLPLLKFCRNICAHQQIYLQQQFFFWLTFFSTFRSVALTQHTSWSIKGLSLVRITNSFSFNWRSYNEVETVFVFPMVLGTVLVPYSA